MKPFTIELEPGTMYIVYLQVRVHTMLLYFRFATTEEIRFYVILHSSIIPILGINSTPTQYTVQQPQIIKELLLE